MFSICESVQEEIAWGRALNDKQAAHASSCASCTALAAQMAALDTVFADDSAFHVPDGFADRVMARLPRTTDFAVGPAATDLGLLGLLERRSIQLVLAHAGAAFTIANLFRFVFSTLMPATSLGAGR